MNTCPKIEECIKVNMVLDRDYAFDYMYAEQIQKVCHNCLAGVNHSASAEKENKVVVTYAKAVPQYL
jgi:hypothetical protein